MLVFKYIEDKDVFQTFYSKMLAKRHINSTSQSEYLEDMLFKQPCLWIAYVANEILPGITT